MAQIRRLLPAVFFAASLAGAQQAANPPVALTIYNQDFAVARQYIDLALHAGANEITATDVTSKLEPDSVVLRDATGDHPVHILEQNYDAAVVTQEWLLQKYEGRTIDFQFNTPRGAQIVEGKIIRAGFGQNAPPLIEVNGKMQFQLPGTPLFPALTDGLLLKPTLRWQIQAEKPERFTAELSYITGGMDWEVTYNVVAPNNADTTGEEKGDVLGWITIHNQSGTNFPQAKIKLMAGDVAKIQPASPIAMARFAMTQANSVAPQVTQKAFDDFHLYDLGRTVALRDGEMKQVQFLDATNVGMQRSYIYDGASQAQLTYYGNTNQDRNYGLDSGNTKVHIVEEIKNSEANHLGMPLPAGRLRFYRRDTGGQIEFIGESTIDHTPAEDTVKVVTGSAFDVKGSRRQTDFHVDYNGRVLEESFEIKVTNQKAQPVKVGVVEHLYRGANWEITAKSLDYEKRDSRTIEFPVEVPARGESTLTYTVRYTW